METESETGATSEHLLAQVKSADDSINANEEVNSVRDNGHNVAFKVPTILRPRQARSQPVQPTVEKTTTAISQVNPDEESSSVSLQLSPPRQTSTESSALNASSIANDKEKQQNAITVPDVTLNRTIPLKPSDVVPYDLPSWSGLPDSDAHYSFEILKGGVIVGVFDLSSRPYTVCGRHASCHLVMDHPSISRYHTVIQYRGCVSSPSEAMDDSNEAFREKPPRTNGFYVYDLGSTHGTFLNKNQLKPRRYYRLFVGHMLRFGGSSRTYLMQGPDDQCEAESPLTVTELITMRRLAEKKATRDAELASKKMAEEAAQEDQGINWGMGDDAVEEEEGDNNEHDSYEEEGALGVNPFSLNAATPNEDSYIGDPKKCLRNWFEREGYELEYDVEEKGQAHFLCRIRLPLDNSVTGEPIVVEASVKGKKKEAVAACALEACRALDRRGALKQSKQEARARKKKRDWAEDDYYDSEEDTFLDRTGTIEKKRKQRMIQKKAGDDGAHSKHNTGVETYESLLLKYAKVNEELLQIEETLDRNKANASTRGNFDESCKDDNVDELEAYMKKLREKGATSSRDKTEISRLKFNRQELKREAEKLSRLIKIARPTSLPSLVASKPSSRESPTKVTTKGDDFPAESKTISCRDLRTEDNFVEKEENISNKMQSDHEPGRLDDTIEAAVEIKLPSNTKEDELKLESRLPKVDSSPSSGGQVNSEVLEEPKKKRHKAIRKSKEAKFDYDKTDPNYAMWIPPEDQSGDGRTSLNEKYGY